MPIGGDDLDKTKTAENHDMLIYLRRDVKWIVQTLQDFKENVSNRFDKLEKHMDDENKELRGELMDKINEIDKRYNERVSRLEKEVHNEIKPRIDKIEEKTTSWHSDVYKLLLGAAGGAIVLLIQLLLDMLQHWGG